MESHPVLPPGHTAAPHGERGKDAGEAAPLPVANNRRPLFLVALVFSLEKIVNHMPFAHLRYRSQPFNIRKSFVPTVATRQRHCHIPVFREKG